MNAKNIQRRFDIDWLRVLLILTVFFYHTGRFFNGDDWHVNASRQSLVITHVINFLNPIMMPAIFILSAAAIVFTLGSRGIGRFAWDKVKRLLIPLVFGIFVLSPSMVYQERLTHGEFSGSLWQFLPHYFDGMYAFGGNFAWMGLHLWYLEVLFIFTFLCLPLFLFLKSRWGAALVRGLAWFFEKPGAIYLLTIPIGLSVTFFEDVGPLGMRDMGGNMLTTYLTYFILGFLIFSDERFQRAIICQRYISLAAGLLLTYTYLYGKYTNAFFLNTDSRLWNVAEPFLAWGWILAILGFGMKYLNFRNRFLTYANEAVLPFYMLHQPVILIVGYFILKLELPIAVQYATIAVISFATIMAIYEYLVRRMNPLRVLFGMKPLKRERVVDMATAQIA